MLPMGYWPLQPKVDCSLPQVKFSYEWGGKSRGVCLSEGLISDDSVFWDHGFVVLIIVRGRRGRDTQLCSNYSQKCSMRRATILIQYPYVHDT